MTLHVGPLPAGDERHLKALEAARRTRPGSDKATWLAVATEAM